MRTGEIRDDFQHDAAREAIEAISSTSAISSLIVENSWKAVFFNCFCRKVSLEEGAALAKSICAENFLEVSAKFGEHTDDLMEQLKQYSISHILATPTSKSAQIRAGYVCVKCQVREWVR